MIDCIMLDIGGTFVKHSTVHHGVIEQPGMFPIAENGTAEQITQTIITYLKKYPAKKIAISMPGPADFKQGIMLMKHKFASMYGICLGELVQQAFPESEISFVHDGVAFMLGEALFGAARYCSSAAGVTLGTGLGFVIFQDGKVLVRSSLSPFMPLWNRKYLSGIAEDYVSGRGIRRRWLELGQADANVKEIAKLARNGNTQAIELMRETGRMLGELLTQHLSEQLIEKIVIGGQISKSWDLMRNGFESVCTFTADVAAHIEDAALHGAYAYADKGETLLRVYEDT